MKQFLVIALLASTTPTLAAEPACPPTTVEAPAAVAFGPYLIEGFGTPNAMAYGLPSCEEAYAHLQRLQAATDVAVVASIVPMEDGTYLARIEPM